MITNSMASPACSRGSIHRVNFLNRTYEVDGEAVKVTNGEFLRPSDAHGDNRGFVDVILDGYGDVEGNGYEDAVVTIEDDKGGGSARYDEARIYAMECGEVFELATIEGGDRAYGGLAAVRVEPGGVRVTRNVHRDRDPMCCASGSVIEHWRWNGRTLVLAPAGILH
jgi:hypothetical protein